ncbi:acyltransferase family protein [Mesorhizobium sp. VNQ89]|uniref:acyltransferase family protein n=1 Tax=Mesorhizobium quangtriensis TaxID=3157709 RepID=UPI0032B797F8
MAYRPEIDGLRAVSVLAVIFFHYGIDPFSGGFVGVDIFFVISGYLITSIIFADMQAETFSFLDFYDRRIRRILPATLATIVVTGIAGYFVLLPSDFEDFGRSAVASAAGFANFYFLWNSGGYFDNSSDLMPLLHMWSLGIEEQFYLLWPLLLFGIVALSKGSARVAATTLALLIAVSFAASVIATPDNQHAAFYLPQTRAWELALGAILVFAPKIGHRPIGEAAALGGAILIVFSILYLHPKYAFPGWIAALPTVGAALIVWPKTFGPVATLPLRISGAVFVGTISFSLYLWHWPLLALYRHVSMDETLTTGEQAVLIALTFVLAVFSWRFIEQPFRRWRPRRGAGLAAGATGVVIVAACALPLALTDGLPTRFSAEIQSLDRYRKSQAAERTGCLLTTWTAKAEIAFDEAKCLAKSTSQPNVLVIGDSHAAHFMGAFRRIFPEISFAQASASGCHPLVPAKGAERCTRLMKIAFDQYLDGFEVIVISARRSIKDRETIGASVAALAKHAPVVVLGPSIEYEAPLPALLARSSITGVDLVSENERLRFVANKSRNLEEALEGTSARFYDVLEYTCPKKVCRRTVFPGVPLMYDDNHFTSEGADFVVRQLRSDGLFANLIAQARAVHPS